MTGVGKKFDGDGTNLYRYVNNDPVNFIDPSGFKEMTNEEANEIIDDARDRYDTTLDALQDMGESGNGDEVLDEAWRGVEEAQNKCATN